MIAILVLVIALFISTVGLLLFVAKCRKRKGCEAMGSLHLSETGNLVVSRRKLSLQTNLFNSV